ncbi:MULTISPECIES: hypothetical protein [unclassified Microcoleus]|uniref:hypothetical protein n=1 Tax=unclassified Microcoleus TaxID=2642155 RepID=UPI001DC68053|nr:MULTISPECIES: hypothetical protein [unclassified Microcoleus]TAE39523.1 MAG: alpha/beta hydrolase [Oscillatoriales cyanobacterium]TAE57290.1 MAG: alpha/beta hydrolase [Oscillatoriales cyanobacterium]TAE69271.1 MAG: alpha/beta hydrolase [Oscillatoriales cyanobacterium]TAG06920.1 MAG: alpha/beta hydrolase [Oscillatoriales cyanobacterium]TAG16802.1 MAG: alpha/beta hydrolase [Oscillatoriales cyanobacterium]
MGIGIWDLAIGNWQEKWIISIFTLRDYQLPITNYQLPITNYQLPITNYPLPSTKFK